LRHYTPFSLFRASRFHGAHLFTLRMAWREMRAAWRHFLYFFVCIALGVGALVAVGLFAANVDRTVSRQARGLMGGDVEVSLSRGLSDHGEAVLRSLTSRGIQTVHVSELVAMASSSAPGSATLAPTQIVELKAVESGYPFYGNLRVDPARPLAELLAWSEKICQRGKGEGSCYGAVVQEAFLVRMGLSVGDRVKIGQASFVITGILKKEPDRSVNAFSLGPRVMISREGLAAADLVKPGSRVRERYLLRAPDTASVQALLYELRGRLGGESARVLPYQDAQPQLRRFLDQLTRYLGLVGLTALFVGGIGVASSIRAFLREKLNTIAILKTLGADSGTVVRTYLLQATLLGLIGSLAGTALGTGLYQFLPGLVAGLIPLELTKSVTVVPLLKGMAMGLLTTLLFTLWPLMEVRDVRPALVFRREALGSPAGPGTESAASRWQGLFRDRLRALTALGLLAGFAALALWQAGSVKVGLLFIGGLVAAVTGLVVGAQVLMRLIASLPRPRSIALRQAISNLLRPGNQAAGMMLAVGIGVMVIVTVSLLERSLVRQIGESRPTDAPTFFFIDIQPDQEEAFARLLHERTGQVQPELMPLVRSRLQALNGKPIDPEAYRARGDGRDRERPKSWYFTREYVLTFLERLPKDNTVIKGRWWRPDEVGAKPLVSVEEEAAKNLGLDLGSTVEFAIQGGHVTAEVTSIRKVEWGNFSTNFYMVLSPGALEGVPFTYVATARVPPDDELALQRTVVQAFPNVTAINLRDVMENFVHILEQLAVAIRAVAVFCVLASGIVMAGALAATRYRRLYESVILKSLGATRGVIARAFAVEYALVGAVAGLIGILLATALSWALLHYILDLSWTPEPAVWAGGMVLTILLTLAVGFLATFHLLRQPPLAILRHE